MKILVLVCVLSFVNTLHCMHDPAATSQLSTKLIELRSKLESVKVSLTKLQGSLQDLKAALTKPSGMGGEAGDQPPTPPGGGSPATLDITPFETLPKEVVEEILSYNITFDFSDPKLLYNSIKAAGRELSSITRLSKSSSKIWLSQQSVQIGIIAYLLKQHSDKALAILYEGVMSMAVRNHDYVICKILFEVVDASSLLYSGLRGALQADDAVGLQVIYAAAGNKLALYIIKDTSFYFLAQIIRVGTPAILQSILHDLGDKASGLIMRIKYSSGENALSYAVTLNSPEKVQAILDVLGDNALENIKELDPAGFTALHQAVLMNNLGMVQAILNALGDKALEVIMIPAGPEIDRFAKTQVHFRSLIEKLKSSPWGYHEKMLEGITALQIATFMDNLDIVQAILNGAGDKVCQVITQHTRIFSPLELASNNLTIEQAILDAVAAVVQRSPDLETLWDNVRVVTFLGDEYLELVQIILKAAGIRAQSLVTERSDWFLEAVQLGHLDVVRELLTVADDKAQDLVMKKDAKGNTALHKAVESNNLELVQLILATAGDQKQALVMMQNLSGQTALHFAVWKKNEIMQEILNAAGDKAQDLVMMQDAKGDTVLHRAVVFNELELVQLILATAGDKKQALVMIQNLDGSTALQSAVSSNRKSIVQEILKAAGNKAQDLVMIKYGEGNTVLHSAIGSEKLALVPLVLAAAGDKKQALVMIQNLAGNTALHFAVSDNNESIVKEILKAAGNKAKELVSLKNEDGKQAADLASKQAGKIPQWLAHAK